MFEKKEYDRRYNQEHKERIKAQHRAYYLKNVKQLKEDSKEQYQKYKDKRQAQARERGQKLKTEVLSHYSNSNPPRCLWCGEDRLPCLSIDHIEGGGRADRRKNGVLGGGTRFYQYLKKAGFPEGFQTLCMNCQWYKRWRNKEK